MAFIYKIYNDVNDKLYVGATTYSIEKRFKEHCQEYKRTRSSNRKLYVAMNKYGINKFHVELIEETTNPEEREMYWIEYYNSFKNGYNSTKGGNGKKSIDYEEIYSLFQEGYNSKEISQILNCCEDTCFEALNQYNVSKQERQQRGREVIKHSILQLDKNTLEVLNTFSSVEDACTYLGKQPSGHIADVCNGKRNTAYGYKWKYKE